jgi:SP family sugar:H+ symporter-like MFS transporter
MRLTFPSFGYDTGQISGFLEQPDFLRRFGQKNHLGEYYFSDVRSGLIVALVSLPMIWHSRADL